MFFLRTDTHGALAGGDLALGDSWSLALHAGVDYRLSDRGALRVNLRWIDIDSEARLDGNRIGTVNIDRGSAVWPTCTGSDPRGVSGASLAPLLPRDVHPPAEVRTGRSRRSSVRPTGDSMNTLTRTALAIALAASATPAFAQSAGHWTTGYGAGYVSQVQ